MTAWHVVAIDPEPVEGRLQAARVVGYDLAFLRLDGVWRAFDDECPHVGCRFSEDGEVTDGVLVCTCHGAEFDAVSGDLLEGPAETPLETYRVRVVEGRIEVEL